MRLLATLAITFCASALLADEPGRLLFEDDFERKESVETKEEVGNGWSTNSKSRANGNKQADLRDGTLHIKTHATADHAASVRHDAAFRNGTVRIRFQLENAKDTLGLNFADLQLKTVHAGHLFKVTVGPKKLDITDLKTGVMSLPIREARMAKTLTPEMQELLTTKRKDTPVQLAVGQWYALAVTIKGNEVSVSIDGKPTLSFESEGFAHPTKRMLRLAVPREAVVDDLKITTTDPVPAKPE